MAARTEYLYDAEGRLIGVKQGSHTESYTLDAVGNRVGQGSVADAWGYDAAHRLQQQGSTTYAYSPEGSRTEKNEAGRITRYFYDVQQRLVRVEDGAGSTLARYGYDPFDRRLWKEAGGARTYYLYADEGLIGEYAADGTALVTYGYLPDGPFSTDVLFVQSGGQTFYAHNDQLGTTLKLTDRSGRLVWSAQHDAFGRASLSAGNTVTFNPRLPGQYFDAETGLHYNFRRLYDPDTGRYLTEDPIGLEGGINLYAYVNGDPVNNIDPTGEILGHAAVFAGCFGVCMLANGIADYANGDCQDAPWDAKDCALTCIPFPAFKWAWSAAPKLWKWARKWWPCKAANSFPGETLVHTKDGLKPIQDIRVGEEVLAWAEWKDEYAYKPVTHIFTGEKEYELVRITLDNGEVIEATAEHPLYVSGEGWRGAGLVRAGAELALSGGGIGVPIEVSHATRRDRTYNLEVGDSHTFLISHASAIVHNGVAKPPIVQWAIRPYADYARFPGDNLVGHEMVQNAWLKHHGYADYRGQNPSVAVPTDFHQKTVNPLQRQAGLWNPANLARQTANQNIQSNIDVLKKAGVSRDIIAKQARAARAFVRSLPKSLPCI
jgi:RHS repeat-associated protein